MAITKSGMKIKADPTGYCSECKREYPIDRFYESKANFLGNGRLNYCIDCCEDIFKYYLEKKGTLEGALYYTCAKIDIPFIKKVYEATLKFRTAVIDGANNKEESAKKFSVIKQYINFLWGGKSLQKVTDDWNDFSDSDISLNEIDSVKKSEEALRQDYQKFELDWGKQTVEDYQFLEYKFDIYTKGKPLTPAQEDLYRELCKLELRQRKKQEKGANANSDALGDSTKDEQAMILQLMDKLKILNFAEQKDKTNIDKILEKQIFDIEHTDPAELVDKEKYKDYCDINKNWGKQIIRACKNMLTGSREFPNIEDNPKDWDDESKWQMR